MEGSRGPVFGYGSTRSVRGQRLSAKRLAPAVPFEEVKLEKVAWILRSQLVACGPSNLLDTVRETEGFRLKILKVQETILGLESSISIRPLAG
jgi:hypothetical protein